MFFGLFYCYSTLLLDKRKNCFIWHFFQIKQDQRQILSDILLNYWLVLRLQFLICYNIKVITLITRMLNKSKQQSQGLPRIQSQKRVNTAHQRKQSVRQPLQAKNQAGNRELKRTLSATNTSKAVKYQSSSLMYAKKIQQLEKQNILLEKQISKVEQEIKQAKKNTAKQGRTNDALKKEGFLLTEASIATDSKVSSKSNVNTNDEKSLGSQIKKTENKILMMRKKIDEQIQRNKKVRKQTDQIRKEITTLKTLNKTIQKSLQKTCLQYNELTEQSKQLDEQITNKNIEMNKTKIESQHKKTQIIKNYDQILKCIEKQLEQDKKTNRTANRNKIASQFNSQILYFTEFGSKQIKQSQNNYRSSLRNSMRRTKFNMATAIGSIRDKIDKYEKQFEQVKKQTGTKNTQEIIKKFHAKYDKNFNFYKYINELYVSLQEKQKENQVLMDRKQKLLQEATAKMKNSVQQNKLEQIQNLKVNQKYIRKQKEKYISFCQNYDKTLSELKQFIGQFYSQINLRSQRSSPDISQLSEQSIVHFLMEIKEACSLLELKFEQKDLQRQKFQENNNEIDLTEMLEQAKKQSIQQTADPKSQRLMTRDDFLKARQNYLKKRSTPKKILTQKK